LNKAAYLIVEGGTHRGIRICSGLGRSKAAKIYYRTLTTYLAIDSDFEDLRDALLDSVDDVITFRRDSVKATIENAFAAVGIGDPVECPSLIMQWAYLFIWIFPPLFLFVFPLFWPFVFPPGPGPYAIQISAFLGVISLLIASALTYRMWFQRK
ncbi:MAG: M4 family metallopeptidase, partial [Candidatus Thorarchaeota archaeon]